MGQVQLFLHSNHMVYLHLRPKFPFSISFFPTVSGGLKDLNIPTHLHSCNSSWSILNPHHLQIFITLSTSGSPCLCYSYRWLTLRSEKIFASLHTPVRKTMINPQVHICGMHWLHNEWVRRATKTQQGFGPMAAIGFYFCWLFSLETVLQNAVPKRFGCKLIEAKEVAEVSSFVTPFLNVVPNPSYIEIILNYASMPCLLHTRLQTSICLACIVRGEMVTMEEKT